jgi:hypothetical protein
MVMRMRSACICELVSRVIVENETACVDPSGAPNAPRIVPLMVTRYVEFGASGWPMASGVGTQVTVVPAAVTLPGTVAPVTLFRTVIEPAVTELASTLCEKTACTPVAREISPAPLFASRSTAPVLPVTLTCCSAGD